MNEWNYISEYIKNSIEEKERGMKMAKGKTTIYFCQQCGFESSKWMGQCPGCKEWNSFVEEPVNKGKQKQTIGLTRLGESVKPLAVSQISLDEEDRIVNSYWD